MVNRIIDIVELVSIERNGTIYLETYTEIDKLETAMKVNRFNLPASALIICGQPKIQL